MSSGQEKKDKVYTAPNESSKVQFTVGQLIAIGITLISLIGALITLSVRFVNLERDVSELKEDTQNVVITEDIPQYMSDAVTTALSDQLVVSKILMDYSCEELEDHQVDIDHVKSLKRCE